jgi:CYTH domain-containing protein
MIELEKTYLVKYLPEGFAKSKPREILDIYIPSKANHPDLRIRKDGSRYEITRKSPIEGNDSSKQEETTIVLSEDEFNDFSLIKGKRVRKLRYFYQHNHFLAEFDIFQDDLKGLAMADFEFESEVEKEIFKMPEFCLADVTQEEFIAGGMLAGKSYKDIEKDLEKFNYQKLVF